MKDWRCLHHENVTHSAQGETAFFGGIFCLEYPSRRNEKGNVYFAKYRFSFRKVQISFRSVENIRVDAARNYRFSFRKVQISFRKVQIFISQSTDFHFAKYRFHFAKYRFSFRKVQISFRKVQIFISQSTDFVSQSTDFVSQSTISQSTISHPEDPHPHLDILSFVYMVLLSQIDLHFITANHVFLDCIQIITTNSILFHLLIYKIFCKQKTCLIRRTIS